MITNNTPTIGLWIYQTTKKISMTKLHGNTPTTAGDTVILGFGSGDNNGGNGYGGDMKIDLIGTGQLILVHTRSEIDSHTEWRNQIKLCCTQRAAYVWRSMVIWRFFYQYWLDYKSSHFLFLFRIKFVNCIVLALPTRDFDSHRPFFSLTCSLLHSLLFSVYYSFMFFACYFCYFYRILLQCEPSIFAVSFSVLFVCDRFLFYKWFWNLCVSLFSCKFS